MRGIETLRARGWDIDKHPRAIGQFIAHKRIANARVLFEISIEGEGEDEFVIVGASTIPENQRGRGIGSEALAELVSHAIREGYVDIRASQVQPNSVAFWMRNRFFKKKGINPTNDYIFTE